ncbi:MAG: SPOR domain-containing protein [Pseudomonadales bacterium]
MVATIQRYSPRSAAKTLATDQINLFPARRYYLKQDGERLVSGTAFLTGNHDVGKVRAMLRLLIIIFIATLLGCGRGGAVQRGVQPPQAEGEWFCEMAENTEDWACVQDPELARSPVPSRLPQPKSSVVPVAVAATAPLDSPEPEPTSAGRQPPEPPPPPHMENAVAPITDVAEETDVVEKTDVVEETDAALQAELASNTETVPETEPAPKTDNSILNMPAEYYAVQLLAMRNQERLEAYVLENNLTDLSAIRIARDGELYHVLLLGIFETWELAKSASREVPPPLDEREPWIRKLGDLQEAMIRGNILAGDSLL